MYIAQKLELRKNAHSELNPMSNPMAYHSIPKYKDGFRINNEAFEGVGLPEASRNPLPNWVTPAQL